MGHGKVELKKIENPTNRQVTFSKRRMGLFKKANEVSILCDAQIRVIIFSGSGRMYEYSSPPWRIASVFDRYLKAPSTHFEEMDIQQKIIQEMTRMKDERNSLRMIMARYMAEDLASFSVQDLSNLEQQIEFSLYKVHLRKQELLDQQLLEIRQREMHMPAEQGGYLCLMKQPLKCWEALELLHHVAAPHTGAPQLHQEGILGKKHGATKSVVVRMFRVVVQCVEDLKLSGWL
ncbi:MADS-box transcription factor 31 [Zea mays]|nr:MADS-box transcription factor 31 [Zea mays]|eukprot:XP_020393872.1 MADS-box transcription factor 31 [Zea mays]